MRGASSGGRGMNTYTRSVTGSRPHTPTETRLRFATEQSDDSLFVKFHAYNNAYGSILFRYDNDSAADIALVIHLPVNFFAHDPLRLYCVRLRAVASLSTFFESTGGVLPFLVRFVSTTIAPAGISKAML
jgi:hypothetical protein